MSNGEARRPAVLTVTSACYLRRAEERLDEGAAEGLIYAALEIRCGVEARLREYLEFQPHVRQKRKVDYRLKVLGKEASRVSPPDENLTRLTLSGLGGEHVLTLYYTPVTKRLRDLAGRCGDLLHALAEARDEAWCSETRIWLEEVWEELRRANLGELLGTPLQFPDGQSEMNLMLPDGVTLDDLPGSGDTFDVEFEYLEDYPRELLARSSPAGRRPAADDSRRLTQARGAGDRRGCPKRRDPLRDSG